MVKQYLSYLIAAVALTLSLKAYANDDALAIKESVFVAPSAAQFTFNVPHFVNPIIARAVMSGADRRLSDLTISCGETSVSVDRSLLADITEPNLGSLKVTTVRTESGADKQQAVVVDLSFGKIDSDHPHQAIAEFTWKFRDKVRMLIWR